MEKNKISGKNNEIHISLPRLIKEGKHKLSILGIKGRHLYYFFGIKMIRKYEPLYVKKFTLDERDQFLERYIC